MLNHFYSIIVGLVVGVVYSMLFISSFNVRPSGSEPSGLQQILTFAARFIFIIIAAIVLIIYVKISIIWFMLSLGIAFWGCVLTKLRVK
ncbi:MAG: hypothetical protein US49_C0006G0168 [candidate division TM6 bacterium GW2011_GWF2_37_49]|nr:MAG: hypothetical protein US49_C0006G0168 [candidate division TM6 bacterium GW2011_GWF2_37_49]